jgi:hypothetical protein
MIGRSGTVLPLLQMKGRGKWRGGHGQKVGAKIHKACRKAYYRRPVTSFETFLPSKQLQTDSSSEDKEVCVCELYGLQGYDCPSSFVLQAFNDLGD